MAINPETQYPGKIKPSSADYPYGEARNITTPGDGTGTPWEAALVNDLFGFQQALLSLGAVVPTGNPDKVGNSQYLQAALFAIGLVRLDYAALRLVTSGELKDGNNCILTDPDHGGRFTLDKSDTTTADDGGTVIVDADGGRWKRVYTYAIDAGWFGFLTSETAANNTTALMNAIAAAKTSVGRVTIKAGRFDLNGLTTAVEDVTIEGAGNGENDAPFDDSGTILATTDTVNSVFIIGRGAVITGVNFFYPDQLSTLSTPIVYPPTIRGITTTVLHNARIHGVTFINSYQCIKIGDPAFACGRVFLEDIQAYPVFNFLEIENALDTIQLNNFILSPGVFVAGSSNLAAWTQDNGIAFIGKLDVESILADHGLVFGMWRGFSAINAGNISLCSWSDVDFDRVLCAAIASGTSRVTNMDFNGCEFLSNHGFDPAVTEPAQIRLTGTADDGTISFTGCVFQSARLRSILIDSDAMDTVNISGCEFKFWGASTGAAGVQEALAVSTADVTVNMHGNTFLNNYTTGNGLGCQFTSAQVINGTGNTFKNCHTPINQSSGTVQVLMLSGNTSIGTTGPKSLAIAGTVTYIKANDNLFDAPSDSPLDFIGSGTPEAVVTAVVGSTFRRTDGGAGTSLYVKEGGTGNTGWVGK